MHASSDDAYDGLSEVVKVTNQDDGEPSIIITQSSDTTITTEAGGTDAILIRLSAAPSTDVVLNVDINDATEGSIAIGIPAPEAYNNDKIYTKDLASSGIDLTFTPSNWADPQTIVVTGLDDSDIDGDITYDLTVTTVDASSDDAYDGLSEVVKVTNQDDDVAEPFVTTWVTNNVADGMTDSTSITIPVGSGTFNYEVDWDYDGITFSADDTDITGPITHDYGTAQEVTIAIRGTFSHMRFFNSDQRLKIINIEAWGDIQWSSMESAFRGCTNLNSNATDSPDLSNVTNMSYAFSQATSFNPDILNWDVSNVTNMSIMFALAESFNSDISQWDVSNVTNMSFMFRNATSFNPDSLNWNVSNVTDMSFMFDDAPSFNPNSLNWNVSNVTNMAYMFYDVTSFNPDSLNWDVSNVTNMSFMFQGADSFNSDISQWDVSNVTDMSHMFLGAGSFNTDISQWVVSNVTDMSFMFYEASSFNTDISQWDVSNVTDMSFMFYEASSFNTDISQWDVSRVNNMFGMFYVAQSFNVDISNWAIESVIDMSGMLDSTALSIANVDSLLNNWSARDVRDYVTLGLAGLQYCSGAAGKTTLETDHNWFISGATEFCPGEIIITQSADMTVTTETGDTDVMHSILCGLGSSGEIKVNLSSSTTDVEYSIDNGTSWSSSSIFSNLDGGIYQGLARYNDGLGITCPIGSAVSTEVKCIFDITSGFSNTPLTEPLISGYSTVCEGEAQSYAFMDSMIMCKTIMVFDPEEMQTIPTDSCYMASVVPDASSYAWFSSTTSGTEVSSMLSPTYDIDFIGEMDSTVISIFITDTNGDIYSANKTVHILTQSECAAYRCQQNKHIAASEMLNNEVPSLVTMSESITSTGQVEFNKEFDFRAGDYIELQPLFEVSAGGTFTAQIEGCQNIPDVIEKVEDILNRE